MQEANTTYDSWFVFDSLDFLIVHRERTPLVDFSWGKRVWGSGTYFPWVARICIALPSVWWMYVSRCHNLCYADECSLLFSEWGSSVRSAIDGMMVFHQVSLVPYMPYSWVEKKVFYHILLFSDERFVYCYTKFPLGNWHIKKKNRTS